MQANLAPNIAQIEKNLIYCPFAAFYLPQHVFHYDEASYMSIIWQRWKSLAGQGKVISWVNSVKILVCNLTNS